MVSKKNKNKRIPRPKIPESKIKEFPLIKEDEKFSINFHYKRWLGSTNEFYKKNEFTNCLSEMKEFEHNLMHIMMEIFPKIYDDYDSIFNSRNNNGHCHPLDTNKIDLVIEIVKSIHKEDVSSINFEDINKNGYAWWYVGFKGSVRIVGLYNQNLGVFLPMMVDHHHLLHVSEKYNQKDYKKFSFCAVNNYEKSN